MTEPDPAWEQHRLAGTEDALRMEPDDARKPESPTDLRARSWRYVARKTLREFSEDQCVDSAAALTYYSVLAIFPAALALLSVLGVVGQAESAVDTVLEVLRPLVSPGTLSTVEQPLRDLAASQAAGFALVVGVLGALWSASAYVGAFSRAMNRIYEVREGRPFWKLRPLMLLVTVVAVTLSGLVLVMLVVSGPVADSIGSAVGLGDAAVQAWNIAKWPVVALAVMFVVALLYYATPNVQQPKFRWISVGSAVAIVIWVLASIGFASYVSNFSSYDKTYGSLAGVVVVLLWLWLTNLALLLGAEVDSELERGRQLQAGIPAEDVLQLPVRDSTKIDKAMRQAEEDRARGTRLRKLFGAEPDSEPDSEPDPEPDSEPGPEPGPEPDPEPGPAPDSDHPRLPVIAAGAAGFAIGTTVGRITRKETE